MKKKKKRTNHIHPPDKTHCVLPIATLRIMDDYFGAKPINLLLSERFIINKCSLYCSSLNKINSSLSSIEKDKLQYK